MKNRTESQAAEEMLEQLRSLIAEAERVVNNGVTETSSNIVADLRDRLQAGLEKLNDYYGGARDKVVAGARRTDETIRAHPYESLAVALGVGVLIGALIRRD
ncbi:hypothetical protein DB347_01140 [Opitutaceae bacterium EW11]|nr:hypothetical protein DB347_01140 [Opitutaceae bacterium EW11]